MKSKVIIIQSILALLACDMVSNIGVAATFIVNSVADDSDLSIDGLCDTGMVIAGTPECTLRAAIEEANASAVMDNVNFNIVDGCVAGICVINVTTTNGNFLPDLIAPINIDGSTQPGNNGVCNTDIPLRPDYAVVLNGDAVDIGLRLEQGSGDSIIRGLNIRNFFNGIAIVRSNNNTIECNFIGTDETGRLPGPGNASNGIILGCDSTGNVIGGTTGANGNLLSSNASDGVQFFADLPCAPDGVTPTNNAVVGNYIGTDKTGTIVLSNIFSGISFFGGTGADGNFVGVMQDGVTISGNLIGGNDSGIFISDGTENIVIMGNTIGTDLSGIIDLGNEFGAIDIISGNDNQIGGLIAGAGNTMAFNGEGVFVTEASSLGNLIQRNRIYDNIGLGIELVDTGNAPDGQTANDPDDSDVGGNGLQNFPELISVQLNGDQLEISYLVPTTNLPLEIEFYQADSANQEGQVFLGADTYSSQGPAMASLMLPFIPESSFRLVATATDNANNTSEFSSSIFLFEKIFSDGFEQ